ncbi:MAG TPA: S53 family peptidase [Candidatus Acidoferrales bacterium]|nr:S53 family peptidase [Candidatus Acidoferrales bacterium]
MRTSYGVSVKVMLTVVFLSVVAMTSSPQLSTVEPQITQPIDNTKLTTLRGNTHPLARSEFDRGTAPASLPMDQMQLVLKHSPEQEHALETLLAQQQDLSSPNYHKWLTPDEFGQQFGPAEDDIQKITAWLESKGFRVNDVSKGRTVIEFSGTASQVQQAFHTAIHRYVLSNGEEHWANASDPQIPTALTPVVAGVSTLHNFYKKPMSHVVGRFSRSRATGEVKAINPQFTYAGGCNGTGTNCYALGPRDFGTIYNVLSLTDAGTNGGGQTIAIVSDSNINVSDVNTFRSLFGLALNPPVVTLTGSDPGLTGDEIEAVLDAEWAGAVAPKASINLVVSPSTNSTFGGDISAGYIVNNTNPIPEILSYSYGSCELALGTSGNAFYNNLWGQAAGEGITVVVSTGDSGSAGCDSVSPHVSGAQPAQYGLAVNGVASTPFNVAVGGTDFDDSSNPGTYWNTSNTSGTQASAKGYIPEIAYNDSCTNSIIYNALGFSSAEAACDSSTAAGDGLVVTAGGAGGASNCTTSDGQTVASCSGGYAKPSWQTGPGVPNDGKRDQPDVSLFAGDGSIQNFYIICEADEDPNGVACNLNSPFQDILGVGGTSVSAQAFAGLMALIDQDDGSRQGNPNPTFYSLASEQKASDCNATGGPANTCVFLDVTSGTIAMPCAKGSPNCTVKTSGDTVGVLSGYNAGAAYDLATGLGSVNVANLVLKFGANFYLSSSSPLVTVSSPGASGTMDVTVYSVNGYTGTVDLACSGLPTDATCSFSRSSVTFTSSVTSVPVTVTVDTTSASTAHPTNFPQGIHLWPTHGGLALVAISLLATLLIGTFPRNFQWNTALTFVAMAVLLGMAACGGNGSGKTGSTTATLTGTASSGTPTSSMTFTVKIQ